MIDRQSGHNNHFPNINVTGDTVSLGPLSRRLLPRYLRWHNDFAI